MQPGQFNAWLVRHWSESRRSLSFALAVICTGLFALLAILDLGGIVRWNQTVAALGFSWETTVHQWRLFQLVTAPLVQTHPLGLLFNMLAVWFMGPPLEQLYGRRRYVVFSVVCAWCGLLGFLAFSESRHASHVGYFAPAFGLLAAHAIHFPSATIFLLGIFPMKIKHGALLLCALEAYQTFMPGDNRGAHAAPLFGALAAWVWLRALRWWPGGRTTDAAASRLKRLTMGMTSAARRAWTRLHTQSARFWAGTWPPLRQRLSLLNPSTKVICPGAACGYFDRGVPGARNGTLLCTRCSQPLPAGGRRAPKSRVLVLAGTERCGKTSLLVRAFDGLCRDSERHEFPLSGQEAQWQAHRRALDLGKGLPPTPAVPGVAWCLDRVKGKRLQRLYVHDLSGLEWRDPQRLARYRVLGRLDGVVLVLDPLAQPALASRYGLLLQSLRPVVETASQPFSEGHLAGLLEALRSFGARQRGGRWDIPVAVVLTKLDVLGLVRNFNSEAAGSPEARAAACRRQCTAWGMDNLVRALEFKFVQVECFATTPTEAGAFAPEKPFQWLLGDERR